MEDNHSSNKHEKVGVTGVSYTPVLTAIIKPTADLVGQELRDFIKSGLDAVKQRSRAANLTNHFRLASKSLGESESDMHPEVDSARQAELLNEWIEGAQDVPADTSELGRLWQNLLLRIILNDIDDSFLVTKLNEVTPASARVLIKVASRPPKHMLWQALQEWSAKERHHLKELASIGVIEWLPPWDIQKNYLLFLCTLTSAAPAALLLANMHTFYDRKMVFDTPNDAWEVAGFILLVTSCWAVTVVFFLAMRPSLVNQWQLTWIGEELIQRAPDLGQTRGVSQ